MSQTRSDSVASSDRLNYTRRESQAWIALPKGHYNVSSGQYMTNADKQRAAAGAQLYNASREKREAKHAELQSRRGKVSTIPHVHALTAFDSPEEAFKQSVFIDHATPPRPGGESKRSPSPAAANAVQDDFNQSSVDQQDRPALYSYAREIEERIAGL